MQASLFGSSSQLHVTVFGVCAVQASRFSGLQVPEPFIPKLTPLHMIRTFVSSQKEKSTRLMTIHTVHTCHTQILDNTFDFCSLFSREEWFWHTGPFITPTHTQVSDGTPLLFFFSLALLRHSWQINTVNTYNIECDA